MIPFLIFNLAGLTVIAILLLSYRSEKGTLSAFASSSVPSSDTIFGRALDLAGRVYVQVPRSTDPRFIPVAALDIIGGTPISILRRGGCCSGLTRVYVTGLGTLGIKAAQVSLYHATGKSRHALAEVSLGAQHVIVDPTYGFYYVDGHGTPIGLAELRQGTKPEYRKLPHSERRPPRGLRSSDSYPANDYYNFDFSCTKTANWTKTVVRRSAYRLLRVLTRGRIDTLRQPLWMEWPQIIVATSVAAGVLLLDFTMWFLYGLDNQLLA